MHHFTSRFLILAASAILLAMPTGCVSHESKDDSDGTAGCVTVDPGITGEELAKINEMLNGSKAYFQQGLFEETIEAYRQADANAIPEQETVCGKAVTLTDGCEVLELTPKALKSESTVILYIHGGAYMYPMTAAHIQMVDELASRLGVKAYMPSYPLLPQVTYEKPHEMVRDVYSKLVADGKKVMLMGDSAGGGFALALAEYVHSQGQKMPGCIVLLSPWLDVTMNNPDIASYEEKDASLSCYGLVECGKLWAGTDSLEAIRQNTQLCPIYGDLTGMPATMLIVGTAEVMYPDVTKLYENLKEQKTPVSLICGKDLFHVYPIYFRKLNLPAASQAIDQMEEFLSKNI